ncbi:AAA family ATPase [Endozoicomonas sp. 4G]|uniref:AAA family ATPase n=1 Tax=Endozoicomonas sp. 4G TaxID=2872754 RepID=UPI0020790FC9|nr:AAA family ATPase [Endozoicomonas sp. 4G]
MQAKLILVGGVPGSGKSYIGKELSKGRCIFIDKDTISRFYTEKLLELLGSHKDDRESEIYLTNVRSIEYETLLKHAFENVRLGNNVVCSAPFISELNNKDWVNNLELETEIADAKLILVWIYADEKTARERIISRGASRDNGKLADWDSYINSINHTPPELDDLVIIDNTSFSEVTLIDQINNVINLIEAD